MGSLLEKSRAVPFLRDEYRVVLTVKDGHVIAVWGRIILQTL
jgi:hypothetical protein